MSVLASGLPRRRPSIQLVSISAVQQTVRYTPENRTKLYEVTFLCAMALVDELATNKRIRCGACSSSRAKLQPWNFSQDSRQLFKMAFSFLPSTTQQGLESGKAAASESRLQKQSLNKIHRLSSERISTTEDGSKAFYKVISILLARILDFNK